MLGWAGGLLARCGMHSRHQGICHVLFFCMLLVVGVSTWLSFFLGARCWLVSAVTLAGMVLLAICDFDHRRRPATI
jgi:hypothetical protein